MFKIGQFTAKRFSLEIACCLLFGMVCPSLAAVLNVFFLETFLSLFPLQFLASLISLFLAIQPSPTPIIPASPRHCSSSSGSLSLRADHQAGEQEDGHQDSDIALLPGGGARHCSASVLWK